MENAQPSNLSVAEKTGCVLVVEDEVTLLDGLKTVLEFEKFTVLTATNGVEALEILNAQPTPPDLILSDIMMPKMDGMSLLQAVRKERRWLTIPFIFLTARGEKVDVIRAKELRVDEYITKPYDPEELLVLVRARIDRHREIGGVFNEDLNAMKNNILTILNHEFRTPLTFVVAYADMLNQYIVEQLSQEEMQSFIHGVSAGADRLRRLIEKFILLVEFETGEAKQNYDLRQQKIEKLGLLLEAARKSAFYGDHATRVCQIHVDDGLPTFTGDADYIRQAVTQMLENAIKFSAEDQPVVVKASAEADGAVRISVTDCGRGIPPAEREQILTTFYQVNRAHYEDQGAGLGLAIVKGVAELHGGRLEIESEAGTGSTFSLLIGAKS